MNYLISILPACFTIVGFLIPTLPLKIKIYILGSLTLIYYISTSISLREKIKKANSEVTTLKENKRKLDDEIDRINLDIKKYEEFCNKRKLFIQHDLSNIQTLLNEYDGFLKDEYREKKHSAMKAEYKLVKKQVNDVIFKEKRDYDEQLFEISNHKDN